MAITGTTIRQIYVQDALIVTGSKHVKMKIQEILNIGVKLSEEIETVLDQQVVDLLGVILMQMPEHEITIPSGAVDIDGDRLEITENEDDTITIKLVKDEDDE